ncbi:MAG TPA: prepilin-type N-terminal cleavage/methylation domain-containing protein [Persephonella sp.]|nr:prepilin-type N-terminal cleavage/methylation domain-containing protein [Hydrogenothermaceae bacterium]HIQ25640.1 prepilin-type N-terminal cleavage/methylation domain-containing protein [Persephonella sp.]
MYSKKGFTLIEILIIVAIIAIAISIVYPLSTKTLDKFNKYIKNVEKKHILKKEKFKKFLNDE